MKGRVKISNLQIKATQAMDELEANADTYSEEFLADLKIDKNGEISRKEWLEEFRPLLAKLEGLAKLDDAKSLNHHSKRGGHNQSSPVSYEEPHEFSSTVSVNLLGDLWTKYDENGDGMLEASEIEGLVTDYAS